MQVKNTVAFMCVTNLFSASLASDHVLLRVRYDGRELREHGGEFLFLQGVITWGYPHGILTLDHQPVRLPSSRLFRARNYKIGETILLETY